MLQHNNLQRRKIDYKIIFKFLNKEKNLETKLKNINI